LFSVSQACLACRSTSVLAIRRIPAGLFLHRSFRSSLFILLPIREPALSSFRSSSVPPRNLSDQDVRGHCLWEFLGSPLLVDSPVIHCKCVLLYPRPAVVRPRRREPGRFPPSLTLVAECSFVAYCVSEAGRFAALLSRTPCSCGDNGIASNISVAGISWAWILARRGEDCSWTQPFFVLAPGGRAMAYPKSLSARVKVHSPLASYRNL